MRIPTFDTQGNENGSVELDRILHPWPETEANGFHDVHVQRGGGSHETVRIRDADVAPSKQNGGSR